MDKLKPCPFCDAEPKVKTYPQDRTGLRGCVEVSCENNHCPVQVVVEENTVEEAAAHWNRRFAPPEVDALQAKIDALMLEYCPDEMTPEQIENWKRHQCVVSPQKTPPA